MSLLDLGPVIFGSRQGLITYLQNKHLLAQSMQCQCCALPMQLQTRGMYIPVYAVMVLAGDVVSAIPTRVYDTRVSFLNLVSPFKSGSFSCISGPGTAL